MNHLATLPLSCFSSLRSAASAHSRRATKGQRVIGAWPSIAASLLALTGCQTQAQYSSESHAATVEAQKQIERLHAQPFSVGFACSDALVVLEVSSHAAGLGIRPGDQVLRWDGETVATLGQFEKALEGSRSSGASGALTVVREGQEQTVALTPARITVGSARHKLYSAMASKEWEAVWQVSGEALGQLDDYEVRGPYLRSAAFGLRMKSLYQAQFGLGVPEINRYYNAQYQSIAHDLELSRLCEQFYNKNRAFFLGWVDTFRANGHPSYAADIRDRLSKLDGRRDAQSAQVPAERSAEVRAGTAFCVHPDGLYLTAYHVVADATEIRLVLADGSEVAARVHAMSASNDLAVLASALPAQHYLAIAPRGATRTGADVFTMGFPARAVLGGEPKYTNGTVSALSGPGGEAGFMQMSVPIQPGNSGGPLVLDTGEVVGVVTSTAAILPFIRSTGTLPQNVNWAVKGEYAALLFAAPAAPPGASDRQDAIEMVTKAICRVEAR